METLVHEISARLEIDQAIARRALGSVLAYVRQWSDADDWSQLVAKLPGVDEVMVASEGLVVDRRSRTTVDNGLIEPLRRSGLVFEQVPQVVGMFLKFVRINAGHYLAAQIIGAAPSLRVLASLDARGRPSQSDRSKGD